MKTIKTVLASTLLVAGLALAVQADAADSASINNNISSRAAVIAATLPVNINTADASQMTGKVKGLGQKRAEAIVAYRTEHGAYKSLDDLSNVKGLGKSFVQSHLDALNKAFTLS